MPVSNFSIIDNVSADNVTTGVVTTESTSNVLNPILDSGELPFAFIAIRYAL